MRNIRWFLALTLLLLSVPPVFSCTVFMVEGNDRVLAGCNEDGKRSDALVWFLPGEEGKLGRVYFGFADRYPQGGMNEAGLFFNIATTPFMSFTPVEGRKNVDFNILTRMMETCASVKEALALFSEYNIPMERAHLLLADAEGDSAVVEVDRVIRRKGHFQLITNFLLGHPEQGKHPCVRYQLASGLLKKAAQPDMDLGERVLSVAAREGEEATQYSTVCDLKARRVRVYAFHDFANFHEFDLAVELKRGARDLALDDLVPPSFAAREFRKKKGETISSILLETIKKENVAAAVKLYPQLKKEQSLLFKELTKTGLKLIEEKKYTDAVEIIRIYVREFPGFAGSHQFLGYAQGLAGQREAAILSLKKALEINPTSKFAHLLLGELTQSEE